MSTLAYASLTARRKAAPQETSKKQSPPGVGSYVDAMAALVPAEVLSLHALILAVTTDTKGNTTTIVEGGTLTGAFFGLIFLSVVLYIGPRTKNWDRLDFLRAAIPPLAFIVWTMLQRATAFDAVAPQLDPPQRTVIALFVAVILGFAAAGLANKADKQPPPSPQG